MGSYYRILTWQWLDTFSKSQEQLHLHDGERGWMMSNCPKRISTGKLGQWERAPSRSPWKEVWLLQVSCITNLISDDRKWLNLLPITRCSPAVILVERQLLGREREKGLKATTFKQFAWLGLHSRSQDCWIIIGNVCKNSHLQMKMCSFSPRPHQTERSIAHLHCCFLTTFQPSPEFQAHWSLPIGCILSPGCYSHSTPLFPTPTLFSLTL